MLLSGGSTHHIGNITFGRHFDGIPEGAFGNTFGGNLLGAYVDYLEGATGGAIQTLAIIPAPASFALILAGLSLAASISRRRR